ncbi:hypothetical protein L1080_004520 [Rhodococcus sp. MSC1_016]|jgi:hypothetical protein|uniref:hypothetical protein n=1 Tax=Rhodococcus sp. MSC1_016 TaxID=2909266 RepID=UPI00202EE7E1|nr:hypothetical protein [Rhodococcus sp. MSC1_016]
MTAPLDDDDLRALSTMLGSQYAILRMPGAGDFPWHSDDELAAVWHTGFGMVRVAVDSFLDPETALALAAAIAEKATNAIALRSGD